MLARNSKLTYSKQIKEHTLIHGDLILVDNSYLLNLFQKVKDAAYNDFDIAEDCWDSAKKKGDIYAFVDRHRSPDCYDIIYGGCHFVFGNWDDEKKSRYSLRWIWLHPSYRRKGILSKHWNFLKEKYDDFHMQPPVSDAMKSFLLKQAAR